MTAAGNVRGRAASIQTRQDIVAVEELDKTQAVLAFQFLMSKDIRPGRGRSFYSPETASEAPETITSLLRIFRVCN